MHDRICTQKLQDYDSEILVLIHGLFTSIHNTATACYTDQHNPKMLGFTIQQCRHACLPGIDLAPYGGVALILPCCDVVNADSIDPSLLKIKTDPFHFFCSTLNEVADR